MNVSAAIVGNNMALTPLDNPIWHALSTTHAAFAEGDDLAKCYPAAVTPLAAMRDRSAASVTSLARPLPQGRMAGLFLDAPPAFPSGWTVVHETRLNQMVWNVPAAEREQGMASAVAELQPGIEPLNVSHVHEMLSLAEMTRPGPFGPRTPELGTYLGIRHAGQLVAMAGERLRFPGYTEVSAVCTHPEHRGRGYAGSLVSELVHKITKRGEIPFLHVAAENFGAIRLYEQLGFRMRRFLNLAVLRNNAASDL